MGHCNPKRVAAEGALSLLKDLNVEVNAMGIGTGSTVSELIKLLPEKGIEPRVISSSSLASTLMLSKEGYTPVHPSITPVLDVYIDGADEVDPRGNLIKGRGAALLGEKILASRSKLNIIIVTREKLVEVLGSRKPVPIEVVKDALLPVLDSLRKKYPRVEVRMGSGKDGPVVTDWGGVVIDVYTGPLRDPPEAEDFLKRIPGVVETGLFLGYTDYVVVGREDCRWEVLSFERSYLL